MSRPSTSFSLYRSKDVDARHKAGHDDFTPKIPTLLAGSRWFASPAGYPKEDRRFDCACFATEATRADAPPYDPYPPATILSFSF
jgi:hypothetical protein